MECACYYTIRKRIAGHINRQRGTGRNTPGRFEIFPRFLLFLEAKTTHTDRMSDSVSVSALRSLLLQKSVRTGTFTLASGKTSDLYIDCRVTTLDAHGANLVGEVGWTAVKESIAAHGLQIDAIGGMTMGADPIALAVGMYSARENPAAPLQVFTVRKEPKGHGRGKQIEGNFSSGNTVIVVDDVITTGGSTLKAIDAIEAGGGKVAFALVLVDREEGGRAAIEERGIPVLALYTRSNLLG
jgi:orotate phosphoribosyltransferase